MSPVRLALVILVLAWLGPPAAAAQVMDRALVAPVTGNAPAWQAVQLPHEWEQSFPSHSGLADYELQFHNPGSDGLLALYIRRACTNLEVFLNGELIGSAGRMDPPVTRNCYYPHLLTLPRALLRPDENTLRIRVAGFAAREVSARQRAAGLSAVQLGELAELQPLYESQRFWNITAAQIIASSVAALGVAMLGLAAVRRKDTYLFYFGLFSLGWALISTRLFVQHVPISHLATEILICSAFPPVVGCAFLFLLRMVGQRKRWVEVALVTQTIAVPLALAIAAPAHLLAAATWVYNLLALEFLVCVTYFFAVAWRHHRREFWLLGAVLLVALVLAAAEIALQNDLLPLPKIHLIHFAMPFIFLVIGLRLIQLFVQALNQAETLNLQLERRVAEKTREIEDSWQQIARLRTAEAAQNERRRIASDLHDDLGARLLTIAQAGQRGQTPERIAAMARQAVDEMRLSVRGLTGEPARAADAFADWRAETVTRLVDAGMAAQWDAQDPPADLLLPTRTHVQLTRVLREAVSNAIRHSAGTRVRIGLRIQDGWLHLEVEDDGRGLVESNAARTGHGLPNIERRVRHLQGVRRFERPAGGGLRLQVSVPLAFKEGTEDT